LDQNGQPTERYRTYRQKPRSKRVLAEGLREAYAPLFALHTDVHAEDREALKGLVSRVTGREQRYVDLITTTFELLSKSADFTVAPEPVREPSQRASDQKHEETRPVDKKGEKAANDSSEKGPRSIAFSYNIQIHLPATTEIAVYNAIFKSLKEHLGE
jgi:hypothetical protein